MSIFSGPAHASAAKEPAETVRYDHWDYLTGGFTVGASAGVNLQLLTRTWRHVRLTCLEAGVGGSFAQSTFDWSVGSTVGFGGHHGPRGVFSHWFVVGAWYGEMSLPTQRSRTRKYGGLFLPVGYEFRSRWGRRARAVWGFRAFVAVSPVGRHVDGACDEDEALLCSPSEQEVNPRLMAGLSIFLGI